MNCEQVKEQELIERYLAKKLTEQESEAFEEHYFGCKRCFQELRLLEAAAVEMRRQPLRKRGTSEREWRTVTGWSLALAAVLLLTFASVLLLRHGQSPKPEQYGSTQPDRKEELLSELAMIKQVPPYVPSTIRGGESDLALEKFRQGMESYQKGNYPQASGDLQAAIALDPSHMPSSFYLGISLLMANQTDQAIAQLSKLVEPESNPYAEEAHWYLAKAYFRKREVSDAEKQLDAVAARNGPHAGEARRALEKLKGIEGKSPSP